MRDRHRRQRTLKADAVVAACGSYTAPLLRRVGVDLPIYPARATARRSGCSSRRPEPFVSTIDDEVKCAMSRLGDELRVAGTIELGGFDVAGHTAGAPAAACWPSALRRCCPASATPAARPRAAIRATGPACARPTDQHPLYRPDPRAQALGQRWPRHAGLDPRRRLGQALAELISGEQPAMAFGFHGMDAPPAGRPCGYPSPHDDRADRTPLPLPRRLRP